jgi:L-ascorbate metabolism protein UlaG (beta-lactamase superfamily)
MRISIIVFLAVYRGLSAFIGGQIISLRCTISYMKTVVSAALFAIALFAAAPQEFKTSAGILQIIPIQHASVLIKAGGKVLYVDPAQGAYEGLPQADYILITDIHGDHMAPAVVEKLKKASTVIVAPKAVAEKFPGAQVMANGDTKTIGEFKVEAIAMYNLKPAENGQFYHEKGRGNGYVITYGGKRFYFAGDTEGTPEMRALKNIDVAFIPMNLPFTMTPQVAAEAVRVFHPAVVYPYHYRGQDPAVFAKALEGTGIDVRILDWYAK